MMKRVKFTMLLSLLIAAVQLQAQDYQITFAILGENETPDSVLVENQSQITNLTLNGGDVLHLVEITGMENTENETSPLKVYPNPVDKSGMLEFYNQQTGRVAIGIYNVSGTKIIYKTDLLSQGNHLYEFSGLKMGTYVITVTTDENRSSAVIISKITTNDAPSLVLLSTEQAKDKSNELKSTGITNEIIEMQYNDGENLKFTAYLNNFNSIEELIPTSSQTINFVFSFPVADFTGTPTTLTEGETVTFTDASTYAASWAWTFEGGTPSSSNEQNPTVTYATAGTYDVSLIATNANGNNTETKTDYITVENGGSGTIVVEITNPTTGKTWMDRNLGASQAATSSTDTVSYGDFYQWGRATDGHEKTTSETTSTLSTTDNPGHGDFINNENGNYDWRSPQNDNLWQGVNGINNPCPNGYRLPTDAELDAERQSWNSNDAAGAFASPLKLPMPGHRSGEGWLFVGMGDAYYWSSTVAGTNSQSLNFSWGNAFMSSSRRVWGFSVRCIKDENATSSIPTVTTTEATEITASKAYTGGEVTVNGGEAVTARGVVYSTTETPTIENNEGITTDGTGTGEFTSWLTELTAETTYYAIAYATNTNGTAYGSQVSFTTLASGNETAIVEVTNPTTGKTWMDRNLGASWAATSSTDTVSYGDFYQWGRATDGHEKTTSGTTSTLSTTDNPGHGDFINNENGNYDWRSPQNDNLWQGVNGINNPCPNGYRLPTDAELDAERQSWNSNDAAGAFASPLKLPMPGHRSGEGWLFVGMGDAYYWSSTVAGTNSQSLNFSWYNASISSSRRVWGFSVRCIKN